MGEGIT
jgi:hypothetical protein